ncbi:biliverdin-producing heme oxygenase [Acinetobacter sp. WZC-1]|uniref:biliverdin-producing heme oxygenase n=1 Tax=Acinetobacter sp. WZC-1 TaxID=3459034 RepID=UPI00403D57CE
MTFTTDTEAQSHTTTASLAQRLKAETAGEHERMHRLMAKADVFASKERYSRFTLAQYYFQQDVEYLFQHPELAALIPDIEVRGRAQVALQDLHDLGIKPEGHELKSLDAVHPEGLGWIYVSEGSTLGAAFLFKEAQNSLGLSAGFGARNLAAYPEGRARVWKRFVQALDAADFNGSQQDAVIQGALNAFGHFGQMLEQLEQLR